MIRFRRSNRVRDITGLVFLALAVLLLWAQTQSPGLKTGWADPAPAPVEEVGERDAPPPETRSDVLLLEGHG